MIETPPTLFRSLQDRDAMQNHWSGILWFRSPRYFRNIEDGRKDPLEGVSSYQLSAGTHWRSINDEIPVQPAFILSFSEIPLPKKYGQYVLKVQNPLELKDRVERRLLQGMSRVEWGKVKYDKRMQLEDHPPLGEDRIRQFFSKPEKFTDDREWRLVITFRHSLPILNETLKLHLGKSSLIDIFEPIPEICEGN